MGGVYLKVNFGKRTLIKIGSSRLLTLPIQWVRTHGFDNSDCGEVEMTMDKYGNLIISPIKGKSNDN